MTRIARTIIFILCVWVSANAQTDPDSLKVTPELRAAGQLQANWKFDQAIAAYQAIVDQNPGSQLAARAQIRIALIHFERRDEAVARAMLEGVASDYLDTPFGLHAELMLLDVQNLIEEDWISQFDALVTRMGGPSSSAIIASQDFVFESRTSLHPKTQRGLLAEAYTRLASQLTRQGRELDGVRVLSFIGANLPKEVDGRRLTRNIYDQLFLIQNPDGGATRSGFPADEVPPRITIINPSVGGTSGSSPVIELVAFLDHDMHRSRCNQSSAIGVTAPTRKPHSVNDAAELSGTFRRFLKHAFIGDVQHCIREREIRGHSDRLSVERCRNPDAT